MSSISGSIVAMVYNFQLLALLGEDGVSAYGVMMYVCFFFVAIFVGYSIGSSPIISYHYGAENRGELQNMFRKERAFDVRSRHSHDPVRHRHGQASGQALRWLR